MPSTILRYQTHIGYALETAGWGQAPTGPMYWLPYTKATIKDDISYFYDAGFRGIGASHFNAVPTVKKADVDLTSDAFADSMPHLVGSAMIGDTDTVSVVSWTSLGVGVTSGSVNQHMWLLGNPLSLTWWDYNGVTERQYQGTRLSDVSLKYTNDGHLELDYKGTARPSITGTTTTPAISGLAPMVAWQGLLYWNGAQSLRLIDCEIDMKRSIETLYTQALTQSPTNILAFPLAVSGKMTVDFQDETEYNYFASSNVSTNFDLRYFASTASCFRFQVFNPVFTTYEVDRSKDALTAKIDFDAFYTPAFSSNVRFYVYNGQTAAYP